MMKSRRASILSQLDWPTLMLVIALVTLGWLNIVSATAEAEVVWDLGGKAGKQLIWMGVCTVLMTGLLAVEGEFYIRTSVLHYLVVLALLAAVLVVGKKVGGARSWFGVGSFGIQPSEFAKTATSLMVAWYLSRDERPWRTLKTRLQSLAIIAIPAGLILLQPDAGTVLVFGGFVFVLYREGLSGNVLLLGVSALVLSVLTILFGASESWYPFVGMDTGFWWLLISLAVLGALVLMLVRAATLPRFRKRTTRWGVLLLMGGMLFSTGLHMGMENILKKHQRERIHVLFGIDVDNPDADYNIRHAKAAIGSGGWTGKGFAQGPMTAYGFVPEQETDFIFCTVGEEWGFLGSAGVVIMFVFLILRVLHLAERQRSPFTRMYAYAVASILFMHVLVNVGMVLGLAPVIGIPLPFFSYGGSSLMGFTLLIGILLRLDGERFTILR
ncbi:rod shape-determining protein RodA [Flavobacteriales bacterium]|nr:rod shape-determining protein RodA [Flavobacteriales bacterium]MEC8663018.1 rod shape-determining protein RodA [Bacteroidota bacterium]